ncbi:MAG: N-acyl homoserine lactonase family protein [Gemmatimonadota bacterium]|nr:MAG: N-acyl homoserine lactonase family protein [Gemmatimonadota bacterium]
MLGNSATRFGAAFILWVTIAGSPARSQAPAYEVYAVNYATAPGRALSDLVAGADSTETIDISFMVWLLKGPAGRIILVDTGFRPDAPSAASFGFEGYIRPDSAVAKLGVTPENVTDIVLTHMHWDHADGLDLFPNAHVWVQKAELEYHAAGAWQPDGSHLGIEPRDVVRLVELNTQGRVTLVDGDGLEIIEGITAYTGARHTYASQYLGVSVAGGTVVIASDNVFVYANLDLHLPVTLTLDAEANIEAQDRMRQIASRPEWIIPGHDAAVFRRFPSPVAGVARIR